MPTYARVLNGVVTDVFTPPAGLQITDCFHADIAAQFILVPAGASPLPGWSYAAGAFAAPAAPPVPSPSQQATAQLAGGVAVTFSSSTGLNATYPCDLDTQLDIVSQAVSLLKNNSFTSGGTSRVFHDIHGNALTFSIPQFSAFETAYGSYVDALKTIVRSNTGVLPAAAITVGG